MLEFKKLENSAPFWDCWSLGVTILEVIIGTEFVILANNPLLMKELLEICGEFLDADLHRVLTNLILYGDMLMAKELL